LAERDGRNAQQGTFHRPSHRARIEHVVGKVLAAVDAGDHQVGLRADNHLEAHNDAIRRRAANRETPLASLAHADRIGQRERMRHAGLVGLRRDYPNLVRKRASNPLRRFQPRRMDAVIVGNEDFHKSASGILNGCILALLVKLRCRPGRP
jgi:hypothetical protein